MNAREIAENAIKHAAKFGIFNTPRIQVYRAYLDLLAKQEGHKLVPLEPSEEMIEAGQIEAGIINDEGYAIIDNAPDVSVYDIYKAMIGVSDE